MREGKRALESLTSAFSDIRRDMPSLEMLRNEVAEILDTYEAVLNQIQSSSELPQETSPIVHNSGMCLKV